MLQYFRFTNNSFIYAFRILLGCIIVWWSLYYLHDSKKMWALISVIIVSDSDFKAIRTSMVTRIINTIAGCVLGLLFIYVAGVNFWSLMGAITVSIVLSTSFKRYPTSWKLAPVTVLIVMVPSVVDNAPIKDALIIALERTGEVLYGSLVAFALGYIFTLISPKYKLNIEDIAHKIKDITTGDGHE